MWWGDFSQHTSPVSICISILTRTSTHCEVCKVIHWIAKNRFRASVDVVSDAGCDLWSHGLYSLCLILVGWQAHRVGIRRQHHPVVGCRDWGVGATASRGSSKLGLVRCILARRQAHRVGIRRQHHPVVGYRYWGVGATASRGSSKLGLVRCILARRQAHRVGIKRQDHPVVGYRDWGVGATASRGSSKVGLVRCILARRQAHRVGIRRQHHPVVRIQLSNKFSKQSDD